MGLFLVVCLFYYYISYIHAGRADLRAHDSGINCRDYGCRKTHSGSNGAPFMAILGLVVQYLCPAQVSP